MNIFCIWHKDLKYKNKTHFNRILHFSRSDNAFFLFVKNGAFVDNNIKSNVFRLYRTPVSINNLVDELLLYLFGVYRFISLLKNKKVNAIYATPGLSMLIASLFKRILKNELKFICDVYDPPLRPVHSDQNIFRKTFDRLFNALLKKTLNNADLYIVTAPSVNKGFAKDLRKNFNIQANNVFCVTNGINLELFNPFKNKLKNDSNEIWILYVGYVGLRTGIKHILNAFAQSKRIIPELKLKLIGFTSKKDRDQLFSNLKNMSLEKDVQFIGEVPSDQISEHINNADICIYCHPPRKRYDGAYPIKIYEYLSMGKTVIAANTLGVRQIIRHKENGYLYSPGNTNDLVHAIYEIYIDKDLKNNIENKASSSIKQFDWKIINNRILYQLKCIENHTCV
jgi:glycosyltransferase involved in cell wall biosynthesis